MNDKRFIFGDFYKKYIDQVLNKIINLSVINKESIFEDMIFVIHLLAILS